MNKDREPFSDMSIFGGDRNPVESGEKFTVEEWKLLTEGWPTVSALLAKFASERTYEERQEVAGRLNLNILFGAFSEDTEFAKTAANTWSLSDEALSRLSQALAMNEMEGKLQKPGKPG